MNNADDKLPSREPHDRLSVDFFAASIVNGLSIGTFQLISAPIDRIQILSQVQLSNVKHGVIDRPYLGIIDCVRRTIKSDGFASLWRGVTPQLIRAIPSAVGMATFFHFQPRYTQDDLPSERLRSFVNSVLLTTASSVAMAPFLYPLEYAQTRLAADLKRGTEGYRQFTSTIDVFRQTMAKGGFHGLYRGFIPNLLTTFAQRLTLFTTFFMLSLLPQQYRDPNLFVTTSFLIIAAAASYPFNTLSRRMMMSSLSSSSSFHSMRNAFKSMMSEGKLTFYRGFTIPILSIIASALSVGSLKYIKQYTNEVQIAREQRAVERRWNDGYQRFEDKSQLLPRPRNF